MLTESNSVSHIQRIFSANGISKVKARSTNAYNSSCTKIQHYPEIFTSLRVETLFFLESRHVLDPIYLPIKKSVDILAISYWNDIYELLRENITQNFVSRECPHPTNEEQNLHHRRISSADRYDTVEGVRHSFTGSGTIVHEVYRCDTATKQIETKIYTCAQWDNTSEERNTTVSWR